jgi:hypothetical protein
MCQPHGVVETEWYLLAFKHYQREGKGYHVLYGSAFCSPRAPFPQQGGPALIAGRSIPSLPPTVTHWPSHPIAAISVLSYWKPRRERTFTSTGECCSDPDCSENTAARLPLANTAIWLFTKHRAKPTGAVPIANTLRSSSSLPRTAHATTLPSARPANKYVSPDSNVCKSTARAIAGRPVRRSGGFSGTNVKLSSWVPRFAISTLRSQKPSTMRDT